MTPEEQIADVAPPVPPYHRYYREVDGHIVPYYGKGEGRQDGLRAWTLEEGLDIAIRSTEPPHYDPSLERLDVAIRAVFRDCLKRRGALLLEGGIEVEGLLPLVDALPYPSSEEAVFKVPYPILAAAQEVLRLYAAKFADDRFLWYQVIRKEPYVVRVPR